MLRKSRQLDEDVLASAARLRARCLALLNGALRESEIDQVTLAGRLGVGKAAVNSILRGNGNVAINSLAEYLAAMGFEIDMVPVPLGEIEAARDERRAPRCVALTMADHDRHVDNDHATDLVVFNDDYHEDIRHGGGYWTILHNHVKTGDAVMVKGRLNPSKVHVLAQNYSRKLENAR
jgi:hypothetical protein